MRELGLLTNWNVWSFNVVVLVEAGVVLILLPLLVIASNNALDSGATVSADRLVISGVSIFSKLFIAGASF